MVTHAWIKACSLWETRIGESRIDDAAQAYEQSLTPDALINMREARRELRALKAKKAGV